MRNLELWLKMPSEIMTVNSKSDFKSGRAYLIQLGVNDIALSYIKPSILWFLRNSCLLQLSTK